MKALKTTWKKEGAEIDAYVQIKQIVISASPMPTGQGGGGGVPATSQKGFGSLIIYNVTEDEEGTKILSRGQSNQPFDMDGTEPIKNSVKNELAKLTHFASLKEV